MPILVIADADDNRRLMRGLDLNVNDYLLRPVEKYEMLARVRTQVRRKRFADRLRDSVQSTMEMAITDSLTGLHNRRYMERQLASLVDDALEKDTSLSVMMVDVDHFKSINDRFGHAVGDDVLREFAARLQNSVRKVDLVCRMGGEEFVIALPETDGDHATLAAKRLLQKIASECFPLPGVEERIAVTASIGVASLEYDSDTAGTLLQRADEALYRAKRAGRNRVDAAA